MIDFTNLMFQWYERNSKGLEIFCKSWLPVPDVRIKGALCFCHGYGDTCTFFFEGIESTFLFKGELFCQLGFFIFDISFLLGHHQVLPGELQHPVMQYMQ